tara:strand:- start:960 stop:1493 length:534 start_codon:yes stop_codon:yes gene_type:complete
MAASRSNTLVNLSVGKHFNPTITGGTSSPDADVIYAFKATASGSSGSSSTDKVILDLQAGTSALTGSPTVTNRNSSGAHLDAEGNAAASLHASNGRIVSIFMYTNPNEHRGNITVSDSDEGGDTGLFTIPVFTFPTGGSQVKTLLVTPHVAPSDLRLEISFAQTADELNVVVLGESA